MFVHVKQDDNKICNYRLISFRKDGSIYFSGNETVNSGLALVSLSVVSSDLKEEKNYVSVGDFVRLKASLIQQGGKFHDKNMPTIF